MLSLTVGYLETSSCGEVSIPAACKVLSFSPCSRKVVRSQWRSWSVSWSVPPSGGTSDVDSSIKLAFNLFCITDAFFKSDVTQMKCSLF